MHQPNRLVSAWNRLCLAGAHAGQRLPRGKLRAARFFLRLQRGSVTQSLYGPALQSNWVDQTFVFCACGGYGTYFSSFLQALDFDFVFVDIGANIGIYSMVAAANPHCVACHAFEPNPRAYAQLRENCDLNGAKVETHNVAISDEPGTMMLRFDPSHSGAGTLCKAEEAASGDVVDCGVVVVDHAAFDRIAEASSLPKIIKIDVEGHEPIVINELRKSKLWLSIHFLYFEADEDRYDVQTVTRELNEAGFALIKSDGPRTMRNLMFKHDEPGVNS